MHEQFHALGDVDIAKQPMEVYPTIHYVMGGVKADSETCASTIPGLFAAGDVRAQLTRQVTTAVGDATTAAIAVEKFLTARRNGQPAPRPQPMLVPEIT